MPIQDLDIVAFLSLNPAEARSDLEACSLRTLKALDKRIQGEAANRRHELPTGFGPRQMLDLLTGVLSRKKNPTGASP
jgi:hypothetical protein